MPNNESMGLFLERVELTEAKMPKLDLPVNHLGWQLCPVEDGPEAKKRMRPAIKALNAGMRDAAKEIWAVIKKNDGYDETVMGKAIGKAFSKHVDPVMKEYKDVGAMDTEPRYEGAQALIDFVKNHYKIGGWTNLGDWV